MNSVMLSGRTYHWMTNSIEVLVFERIMNASLKRIRKKRGCEE